MSEKESDTQLNRLWRYLSRDLPPICKYCVYDKTKEASYADNVSGSVLVENLPPPCNDCYGSDGRYGYDPVVPDTPEGKLIRLLILISIQECKMIDVHIIPYDETEQCDKLGNLIFELESLLYAEEEEKRPFITITPDIPLNNSWLCPICHKPVLKKQGQCRIQEGNRYQNFHGKCYSQFGRYEQTLHELNLFLVL